jgi:hypothetical protein
MNRLLFNNCNQKKISSTFVCLFRSKKMATEIKHNETSLIWIVYKLNTHFKLKYRISLDGPDESAAKKRNDPQGCRCDGCKFREQEHMKFVNHSPGSCKHGEFVRSRDKKTFVLKHGLQWTSMYVPTTQLYWLHVKPDDIKKVVKDGLQFLFQESGLINIIYDYLMDRTSIAYLMMHWEGGFPNASPVCSVAAERGVMWNYADRSRAIECSPDVLIQLRKTVNE